MHREVIKAPDELLADHINRNSLDNRKANLRPATHAQNVQNRTKNRKGKYSSKYKGVTWNCGHRLWQADIKFNGNHIFLGSFDSETGAAKAYDRAAKRYHGEFAVLNFPQRKRRTSQVVPFIVGVILTCLAYLSIWKDRQMFLMAVYQQLTAIPILTIQAGTSKVAAMAKMLYIIDGHAHIYGAYYAPMSGQLTGPSGEPTKATYIFTNIFFAKW